MNNTNLRIIEHFFKTQGIVFDLRRMNKKLKLNLEGKSIIEILDELKINYNITNQLNSIPCIKINRAYSSVIDSVNNNTEEWIPDKKNFTFFKANGEDKYVTINSIENSSICYLNLVDFIKQKYDFIFKNIIINIFGFACSAICGILMDIMSIVIFSILDYFRMYSDYDGLIKAIFVFWLLLFFILILQSYICNFCIKKNLLKTDFSKEKSAYLYLINSVISIFVSLGVLYQYSFNLVLLIILQYFVGSIIIYFAVQLFSYERAILIMNVYLSICLVIYLLLLFVLIFNSEISLAMISIPIIPYIYFLFNIKHYANYFVLIFTYNHEYTSTYIKEFSNKKQSEVFLMKGDEDLYLYYNINGYVIQNKKVNLIIGENGCGKTYIANYLSGKKLYERNDIKIFLNDSIPLNSLSQKELCTRIKVISNLYLPMDNHSIKSYILNNQKVYTEDYSDIFEKFNLNHLLNENSVLITDTERFLIEICKQLLSNPYILVFDNIISRFSVDIINNILDVCLKNNITVIIMEQKDILNVRVDNKIFISRKEKLF